MPGLFATSATAALLVAAGGAYVATPFILSGWAEENLLYTKVPEGTGKAIVKGKSFHRLLLSFDGHHLNEPGKPGFDARHPEWEILTNIAGTNYETRPKLTRSFGLYWVGIPGMRSVYRYNFVWNEYREKLDGSQEVWHRDEKTEIFMANDFPYVMVIEDAKTKDNLPVRAEFVIIVRITNPFKALFASNDWRSQLESYVDRQARNFIGTFTYDDLRSETDEGERCREENFSEPIRELTFCLPEEKCLPEDRRKGTKGTIGITVYAANLESIVLSGPAAEENEKLSVARYTADRNAETTVIAARAQAEAITLEADAQAHATTVTGEAEAASITARLTSLSKHPELASALLMSEAIAKPGDGKVIIVPSDILGMVGNGLQGAKKASGGVG